MEIVQLIVIILGGLCALYMILDAIKDAFAKRHKAPSEEVKEAVESVVSEGRSDDAAGQSDHEEENEADRAEITSVTRKVRTDSLYAIGCQFRDGEEGELIVKYQGETFVMSFSGRLARIWDSGWMSINVEDPTVPLLRHAINNSNYVTGNAIVVAIDKDEPKYWLHTVDTIMLHPANPDNTSYIRSVLDNFFATKHHLGRVYQDMIGVHSAGTDEEKKGEAAPSFPAPSPN